MNQDLQSKELALALPDLAAADHAALKSAVKTLESPNLAARIADSSRGGDVVMLHQVLDEADRLLIDGHGITIESFTTKLRGIDDDQYLTRLTVTDPSGRNSREAN